MTTQPPQYDPNFAKWIVQAGPDDQGHTSFYGPLNTEQQGHEWAAATHTTPYTVLPLFPPMVS